MFGLTGSDAARTSPRSPAAGRRAARAVRLAALALVLVVTSCDEPSAIPIIEKRNTLDLRGEIRTRYDSPNPTEAQLARRRRSLAVLEGLGVPSNPILPVVEDEADVVLRQILDVAGRAYALEACAVKGESGDHAFAQELVDRYRARPYLSPVERDFLDDSEPGKQELIDHRWGYECVHVMLWALGQVDELRPPNEICDVPGEAKLLKELGSVMALAEDSTMRPLAEVLDAADLYDHLQWSATEMRIRGTSSEALNGEITMERLRALNWLIRLLDAEWDDVSTDT